MKVLWISNILFPQLCQHLGFPIPYVGGWMEAAALNLLQIEPTLKLAVVSFWQKDETKTLDIGKMRFYIVPERAKNRTCYDKSVEMHLLRIKNDFHPDLVHIHGTEYGHSLAWVRACGAKHVVVSIQGLVHFYASFFLGGIDRNVICKNTTFRDVVRADGLLQQQKKMATRGNNELELLSQIENVIGRTSWDRSCVWMVNPKARYYFCNETLRKSFYNIEWRYEECQRYSIFLSQAHYPIKGLHQVIKSLPFVLRDYPDTHVYVAGNDFVHKSWLKKNGYAKYIYQIIKDYHVENHITFLGPLSEKDMVEQYRKANIFICPSAIENSPNSIGEAQLIGTPVISSYVGGSMDMVEDGVSGFLYRFEETPLLALRICQLFGDIDLCKKFSENERCVAKCRHNQEDNARTLISIYEDISSHI